jgi:hypothetical protein
MSSEEDLKFRILDLGKCFLAELSLLKECYANPDLEGRAKEVRVVIASACSTGSALYSLSNTPQYFYAEMVMLARAFIEKITNFCYLQICSDKEFRKFLMHPFYKLFHNTDRGKRSGQKEISIKYSGRNELLNNPKIKEALQLFSETNSKKNWSDLGIDQKVALIGQKTNIRVEFFLLNTLSIYSDASESLHGSLYGCALPTGAFVPNAEPPAIHVLKYTAILIDQLGSMINETIRLLSLNKNIMPIFEKSNEIQKKKIIILKEIVSME